jgi:hypothetical protein
MEPLNFIEIGNWLIIQPGFHNSLRKQFLKFKPEA